MAATATMTSVEPEGRVQAFPDVVLRDFRPDDVQTLKVLTHRALGEDYPPSLFLDIHGWWPEGFIIAESGGEVVGFVAGIVSAPRKARVLMLAVQEGHRDRGIGSALMDAFTRRCRDRGLRTIELEVRTSNAGAIRFYENRGFETRYLLPRFYTDGEDGYKMARALPRS